MEERNLTMEAAVLPVLNYAMEQNGAQVVQRVALTNPGTEPLRDAEVRITSSPGFLLPSFHHIDCVPAGQTVELSRPRVLPNGEYLASITERVTGVVRISVWQDGRMLTSLDEPVTALAFDEWQGIAMYPELLSAFVTPNHPDLAGVVGGATWHLGRWTGDTAMDGYQSQDANRVLKQAAALYAALKEQSIAYAVPPASFEQTGQRVRLCDAVLRQKLGTCLDLSLLYAACLEAVGLHPLLITTPGHIFAGVWLEERMFPECIQDDASLITKRLASGINEIAVVETTCIANGRDMTFDEACAAAQRTLETGEIEYIIDVHRCRLSGITPLPQRIYGEGGITLRHSAPVKTRTAAPRELEEAVETGPVTQEEKLPKKLQWERKLLDLGLRNTLINLRLTKTQLPILAGSLDQLEDALSDGSDFSVLPRPGDLHQGEFTFENLRELGESEIIHSEFRNKRLRAALTEGELTKNIKELYRTAKTAMEENGANTLYLALGMLRWYETPRSTKARYAPVILLPIEMVRKSAAQGYVIRLRDEEPQMNITLLEKLKQDFGIQVAGLDPLPTDEHGIDIRRVLTVLRKAVMEQPRWDVLEAASIGIFSFSQFVMWNDIRNRTEDLLKSKVVRSLMEGRLAWEAKPLEMGDWVSEDDVLLPMAADASQLFAIKTAGKGETFVLHGPPGTGKSQTITSMIALALAEGKRVLFVAEKMAALEVVQKRLDRIGIGAFCLELHSNKSKKKDVLEQLRQASEVAKTLHAQDFVRKAQRIAESRRELNEYARQLHLQRPWGSSLYSLIGSYEQCKDAPDIAPFDREFLEKLDAGALEQMHLAVERLVAAGREVGHPGGHPLLDVGCTQYSQSLRSTLHAAVDGYTEALCALAGHAQRLTQSLGERPVADSQDLQRLAAIASNLSDWYTMPTAWAQTTQPQLYFGEVAQMARHFAAANGLEARLLETFTQDVFTLNGAELYTQWAEAAQKWFLPKALETGKLLRKLNVYAKTPTEKAALQGHITALRDYQREKAAAEALFARYGADLGTHYAGSATAWESLAELADLADRNARELYTLTGSWALLGSHCGKPEHRDAVLGLHTGFPAFCEAKGRLDALLKLRQGSSPNWIDSQLTLCQRILEHEDVLKEWIAYNAVSAECEALGLGNVVRAYRAGESHDSLYPAYQKALLRGLIEYTVDGDQVLGRFSGAVFSKKIQQFKRMDQEWMALSQEEIYCRLAARVPNFTMEAAHSSELGILQRCIKSGGRGTSIRRLFDQIPNLLPRLCPCMLMSPISAAQYLDPKRTLFDLVVFDEASQLPTCKAVGVLARGTDAVIVGDPKQMPPTSFFSVNTVDEENLEQEDLESILDDCLALNMPQSHLLWHYRSRHESLIAFSNSRFYENKLYTFPSVNDRQAKVRLVQVDGVFDRGKTRRNLEEAKAVVEELKRRCHDPELSVQSVGVVTFNIAQQNLIDDLLSEACVQDQALEKWAYGGEEPVFIKNLENVQGDERDVILFSVGYGPDEQGKVYMNFGPLNRDGGWRRLNVAVTRSRCEMVVFSTLKAEQIDLSRTRAEGVAALRAFLEYAEGRQLALDAGTAKENSKSKDGVALSICKVLEEAGYETDLQVGRSRYRIDIGVADPAAPDQYILGILLDGGSYGQAKTTRDREVAQQSVLEGLGWHILRVWTMDWWDNSAKECKRILEKLESIRTGKEQEPAPAPAKPQRLAAQAAPVELPGEAPQYRPVELPAMALSADVFLEPGNAREIQKRIRAVAAGEAPVSAGVLTKRVVQSFGIARAGSRIQAHMQQLLQKVNLPTTVQEDQVFYWSKEQNPAEYPLYRVGGGRDVREIPLEELANAACAVLREQISMSREDLLRETGKKLGLTRLGGNATACLEASVDYAMAHNLLTQDAAGSCILTPQGAARAEATQKAFKK